MILFAQSAPAALSYNLSLSYNHCVTPKLVEFPLTRDTLSSLHTHTHTVSPPRKLPQHSLSARTHRTAIIRRNMPAPIRHGLTHTWACTPHWSLHLDLMKI